MKKLFAGTALCLCFMASGSAPTFAATECTAEAFTVGGVFDSEGYLACLAIPATGSDVMGKIAIASGISILGVAAIVGKSKGRQKVS